MSLFKGHVIIVVTMDELGMSMVKLLRLIGCPYWFQRIKADVEYDGKPMIKVIINKKPPVAELDRLPRRIDGFAVKIVYVDPVKLFKERFGR